MRRSGMTAKQMLAAPMGAHYVWVNSRIEYPVAMALHLGRTDLKIVPPDFLDRGLVNGRRPQALVIDHACMPNDRQLITVCQLKALGIPGL